MVPRGALQHPASVIDLSHHEAPRIAAALVGIVRHTVLLLAQQNVAPFLPGDTGQKPALRREKTKIDSTCRAGSQQGGAGSRVGKAQNTFQRVQGKAGGLGVAAAHHNGFAVQRQIGILGQHKERVEKLSHDMTSPSMWARRYAAGSDRRYSAGRQSSLSEQALQCFPGLTLGV